MSTSHKNIIGKRPSNNDNIDIINPIKRARTDIIYRDLRISELIFGFCLSLKDVNLLLEDFSRVINLFTRKSTLTNIEKIALEKLKIRDNIFIHPDNIRYLYNILEIPLPEWFVTKWRHTFSVEYKIRSKLLRDKFQRKFTKNYDFSEEDIDLLRKDFSRVIESLNENQDLSNIQKASIEELKNPSGILMNPDNVRFIYNILEIPLPEWFVTKWRHTFNIEYEANPKPLRAEFKKKLDNIIKFSLEDILLLKEDFSRVINNFKIKPSPSHKQKLCIKELMNPKGIFYNPDIVRVTYNILETPLPEWFVTKWSHLFETEYKIRPVYFRDECHIKFGNTKGDIICDDLEKCFNNNNYFISINDVEQIVKEFPRLIDNITKDPNYINNPLLKCAISILEKCEGIFDHPDNLNYLYEIIDEKLPDWFIDKWKHTFNDNKSTQSSEIIIE